MSEGDEPLRHDLDVGREQSSQNNLCSTFPGPLTFIIFVPNWNNGSGCVFLDLLLTRSDQLGYLSGYIEVGQFEHQYSGHQTCQGLVMEELSLDSSQIRQCRMGDHSSDDGKSHHCSTTELIRDVESIKAASFDSICSSFMIILQNNGGRTKWPISKEFFDEVRTAWKCSTVSTI